MKIVFGDLEADGLLDSATKVWCGVFKDRATKKVSKFRPNQISDMLKYLDTVDVLIMHNGIGYDKPLLRKLYGYEFNGRLEDTLLLSRLLNPNRPTPPLCPVKNAPHSIEAWGFRVGRYKPSHEDWSQFSEEMLHRCTEDVEILSEVYEKLQEETKGGDWGAAINLTYRLFENLQKQEEFGWLVDRPFMEKCIRQLDRWIGLIDKVVSPYLPLVLDIQETKKEGEYNYIKKPFLKSGEYSDSVKKWMLSSGYSDCSRIVVGPFSRVSFRNTNLNSNEELKNFLLNEGWEPKEWNTNDSGEKTSAKLSKDDPFEGIEGRLGRIVAKRVQCRQRKSIIEGLINSIRPDGRIGASVAALAATGRCTHRGIVNIPRVGSFYGKQLRKMFICPKGKVLVGTDSDGNQIRQLCARMGDNEYTQSVIAGDRAKGTDIHTVNQKAAGLPDRDKAKTFFYAFIFGAGDKKIGKIVGGSSGKGKELREDFLEGLPALKKLLSNLSEEWRKTAKRRFNSTYNSIEYLDGWIFGLDGRPIQVPFEHQLLVYLLQSDEAIQMSAAYNWFHKQMERRGYVYGKQYGVVCFMHDEFTVECDEDIAEEVKQLAEDSIVWAGQYYKIACPHAGNGKIGRDWSQIH